MQDETTPAVAELEEMLKRRSIMFCNILDRKTAMINQLVDEKKALRDENEALKAHIARIEAAVNNKPEPCDGRIYSESCAL